MTDILILALDLLFAEGGGLTDKDEDGLSRNFEEEIGTNPNSNDSDNDLLTDGDEVLKYKTDPLKKIRMMICLVIMMK
ncbi:MAG: hypothetical protein H6613_18505 [Ignavibacteriales bacterium]|nr:hypothetical protein [Ignavibacteriales bacterium]